MNNNITLVQEIFTKYTRPPKLFIIMKQKTKNRGRDNHKDNTLTISSISRHTIYEKTRQMRQTWKDKIIIHPIHYTYKGITT